MPPAPASADSRDRFLRFGLASARESATSFERFHRHNEIELRLVESGCQTFLFGHRTTALRAGSLAVFWGALPHKLIEVAPRTSSFWVTVPLAWFLEWNPPGELAHALLHGTVVVQASAAQFRRDRLAFRQWHRDLRSADPQRRKTVLLEVEARLRRLALGRPGRTQAAGAGHRFGGGRQRVERLARFIAEHYREPLTAARIAASAGLTPEYATTLFRRTTGMTLIEYVTEHRIAHAQRLLTTTARNVLDVGLEAGFGSASRFYEAFTRACGQTPRAFRLGTRTVAQDERPG